MLEGLALSGEELNPIKDQYVNIYIYISFLSKYLL